MKPDVPNIAHTELSQPITEFALSLSSHKDGIWAPGGTCIIVAPYLAMTARHVIEEDWRYLMKNDDVFNPGTLNAGYNMHAVQILNEGKHGALWDVRKIFLSNHTDIAFLYLNPLSDEARDYKWRMPKLQFTPPKVGTSIFGFGYTKTAVEVNAPNVQWQVSPQSTEGIVQEIHHVKRDSCSMPFPCFRTNAPFLNHMSGGPVFSENGLVGIISRSMEPQAGSGEEYISYASLLWPSLLTEIDINRAGYDANTKYRAYDLCKDNFIKSVDLEVVIPRDNGLEIRYENKS